MTFVFTILGGGSYGATFAFLFSRWGGMRPTNREQDGGGQPAPVPRKPEFTNPPAMDKTNKITTRSISVSALKLLVPVFIVTTALNFFSYIPHGILARTMGIGSSWRTDVLERFFSSQSAVLLLAVLVSTIIASAEALANSRVNSSGLDD